MKERPILFSSPMVRAILSGQKTQTRRTIRCACNSMHHGKLLGDWSLSVPPRQWDGKEELWNFRSRKRLQPSDWIESYQTDVDDHAMAPVRCPYGQPGDRLWVREPFCLAHPESNRIDDGRPTRADGRWCFYLATEPDIEASEDDARSPWKPSIHMPRWASRITLEVLSVRVERLQDISEEDARAEGVCAIDLPGALDDVPLAMPRDRFAVLWSKISGPESWEANPWVWVVTFRVLP